jgi:collagenase-like PrtC family protease
MKEALEKVAVLARLQSYDDIIEEIRQTDIKIEAYLKKYYVIDS